jgi:LytS/YehU family sensor histidine kinase
MPHAQALIEPLFAAALGIGLTHAYRNVIHKRDWRHLEGPALVMRMVAASATLGVLLLVGLCSVDAFVFRHPIFWLDLVFAWMRWSLQFFVWSAIYFGTVIQAEKRRLRQRHDEAMRTAELHTLKAQLNPHFLFNSLNSVRALITEDPDRAQEAVTQLAKILRYALTATKDELVTVERELEMVEDYLGLESLRLGVRLRVEREIAHGALGRHIPVMLLQTLVENAVKHGIACLPNGGTLRIAVRVDANETLLIDVENPRPSKALEREDRPKVGLANALERSQLLFGPGAALSLDLSDVGRAHLHVRLPQVS